LDKFIEHYLICNECSDPEIFLKVKGGKVVGKCDACGADKNNIDNTHKITKYILQNPPVTKSIADQKKSKNNEDNLKEEKE